MFTIFYLIFFGILGAIFASFAVAQVWRLRASQIANDKEELSRKSNIKILKNIINKKDKVDRSRCLHCGYYLRWFDLVPILSWIILRGKCRKCHKKIGYTEIVSEIFGFVIFSVLFIIFNPIHGSHIDINVLSRIICLYIIFIPLLILFIYDLKWSLLPTKILWIFNILAFIYWCLGTYNQQDILNIISNLTTAIIFFPITYLILSLISKGKWVGDGDWILALGLVLLMPNLPIFTILLLLLSNIIGLLFIVILSLINRKKIKRGAQIPFGPAMILAALIIILSQGYIFQILVSVY